MDKELVYHPLLHYVSMHPTTIFLEKMGGKQGCWNSTSSTTPIKVYCNTSFLTVLSSCIVVPAAQELVLEVFQALTSNTQIVKESIQKGMPSADTPHNKTTPLLLPLIYFDILCGHIKLFVVLSLVIYALAPPTCVFLIFVMKIR